MRRNGGALVLEPPIEPMLAAPAERLPASARVGELLFEPQFDGCRALLFVAEDDIVIQSRQGADLTAYFPEIVLAAATQLPPGTVLDGELVIRDPEGASDPSALQSRLGARGSRRLVLSSELPASFLSFDLLARAGEDVRGLTLWRRRQQLERLLRRCRPPIQLVPQTDDVDQAREWLDDHEQAPAGLEGVVIKRAADPYQPGRRGWLTLPVRETHEVVLGAVLGSLHRPQRLVLGRYDEAGRLVVVGSTVELDDSQVALLRPLLGPPRSSHPWPTELPAGRLGRFGGGVEVTLVEPLVVEVSADQGLEHDPGRHRTRFVRTRPDLNGPGVSVLGPREPGGG